MTPPSVSGTPAYASRLTADPGTWSDPAVTFTYQWRRDGVNLVNGGAISGAATATLTINPVALADCGAAFDCIIGNACGSVTSHPAGLRVNPSCPADFTGDGVLNSQDFFAFLAAFFAGCP